MPSRHGLRLARLKRGAIEAVYPIGAEPLTFGRDPENRVVLLDDRASKRHAVVAVRDGLLVVEDLKSLNGTRVNERKVRTHPLKPGDLLRVGWCVFLLLTDGMPLSRHTVHPTGWVIGRRPGGGGLKLPVTSDPILIGRADESDVRLEEADIADYHALITALPSGAQLIELAPEPPRCTPIEDGADIQLGPLTVKFRAERPAAAARPAARAVTVRKPRPAPDRPGPVSLPPAARESVSPKMAPDPRPAPAARPSADAPRPAPSVPGAPSDASLLRYLVEESDRLDREPPPAIPAGPPETIPLDTVAPAPGRAGAYTITATQGPRAGESFPLGDRRLSIGSDAKCSIVLSGPGIAPCHATIGPQEGDLFIEDHNSAGGVFLNGQRIRKRPLKPGDLIRIGASEFLVHL